MCDKLPGFPFNLQTGAFYEGSITLRALEVTAETAAKSRLLDPFGSWLVLKIHFCIVLTKYQSCHDSIALLKFRDFLSEVHLGFV